MEWLALLKAPPPPPPPPPPKKKQKKKKKEKEKNFSPLPREWNPRLFVSKSASYATRHCPRLLNDQSINQSINQ